MTLRSDRWALCVFGAAMARQTVEGRHRSAEEEGGCDGGDGRRACESRPCGPPQCSRAPAGKQDESAELVGPLQHERVARARPGQQFIARARDLLCDRETLPRRREDVLLAGDHQCFRRTLVHSPRVFPEPPWAIEGGALWFTASLGQPTGQRATQRDPLRGESEQVSADDPRFGRGDPTTQGLADGEANRAEVKSCRDGDGQCRGG